MKLYGYRNGRTLRAAWALAEAQASFEYIEVDLFKGEGRSPAFLAINPFGKVPVLVDGDQVITESAAICLYLAEKFPECGLVPARASPERAQCYRWISFILTEMDAPLWTMAKHRFVLPPERRVTAVIDTAAWEFGRAAEVLANHVSGRACLVGSAFSVADILAAHVLLWAKSACVLEPHPSLEAYLETVLARPAYARTTTTCSR